MPLDPNTWTQLTRNAVEAAQAAARERANPEITPDHLLGALLRQDKGIVLPLIRRLGLDPVAVRNAADEAVAALPQSHGGETRFGREFTALIDAAVVLRKDMTDEYLSTEHLLLALVDADQKRPGGGRRLGQVDRDQVLSALQEVRGSQRVTNENPEDTYQSLEKYGRDLTESARTRQARSGHRPRRGDPSRRPGAQPPDQEQPRAHRRARRRQDRRRRGPGPAHRRGRRSRVAEEQAGDRARPRGDGRRRQVPRRVRGTPQGRAAEITDSDGEIITFIDEMHTVVGAGAAAKVRWTRATCSSRCWPAVSCAWSAPRRSTSSASTSRRTLRWSGASSRCYVGSPRSRTRSRSCGASRSATRCTTACASRTALVAAAVLSDRYLTGRFLPDKAIDLIDEAASTLRIEIDSVPTEIDVVERRIRGLEIERVALAKETTAVSTERLASLDEELANLNEQAGSMKAHWQGREGRDREIQEMKERLEDAARRGRPVRARRRTQPGLRDPLRPPSRARTRGRGGHGRTCRAAGRLADAEGGGRREDVAVVVGRDRHPGQPPDGGRDGQAGPPRGGARRAGRRPGRGRHGRGQRHPSQPRRNLRPDRPSARSCFSAPPASARPSWPDRWPTSCSTTSGRWCASTCPSTWRSTRSAASSVRLPATSGTTRVVSSPRRSSPAVRGRAARRGREGPRRRVQRAVAVARRRAPDRRSGPHGRLHQRRADHDVQPARRAPRLLPARVHQPVRRHRAVPGTHPCRHRSDRRHPARPSAPPPDRSPHRARPHRGGAHQAGRRGLRPRLWRPSAEAGDPAPAGRSSGHGHPGGHGDREFRSHHRHRRRRLPGRHRSALCAPRPIAARASWLRQ
jgi:hypothetical protein